MPSPTEAEHSIDQDPDGNSRWARVAVAVSLVGSLAIGGSAAAANEGRIVLAGNRPGCYDLTLSKDITLFPVDSKAPIDIKTKGQYAAYALYPADRRHQPGSNNTSSRIYTRDRVHPIIIANQKTFKRAEYKLCLYADSDSTVTLAATGLKGTLRPRLKPLSQSFKPDFYSKVISGPTSTVDAAQGLRRDVTITYNSWQVADKELIINGTGASLGERPVCIKAKDTNDAFCNKPPNPYNIHPGAQGSSDKFSTPVNLMPGAAKPGRYEASYQNIGGAEVNSRVAFTSFQFTPVQN